MSRLSRTSGYTLIEILMAMVIFSIVAAGIYTIYSRHQRIQTTQQQVVQTQQNLRAANFHLTRDIRMAGYFSNLMDETYQLDWDNNGTATAAETIRPMLFARNNTINGTDQIVIIKASDAVRPLTSNESASGSTINLDTALTEPRDLNGDDDPDLDNVNQRYGFLIRWDMTGADFFQVTNSSGSINTDQPLNNVYSENDWIMRADIIIYKLDGSASRPRLLRSNLGTNELDEPIAEDIENLQFSYVLYDQPTNSFIVVDDPTGREADVRSVAIDVVARTTFPTGGYTDKKTYKLGAGGATTFTPTAHYPVEKANQHRRRLLRTVVETRNIGL